MEKSRHAVKNRSQFTQSKAAENKHVSASGQQMHQPAQSVEYIVKPGLTEAETQFNERLREVMSELVQLKAKFEMLENKVDMKAMADAQARCDSVHDGEEPAFSHALPERTRPIGYDGANSVTGSAIGSKFIPPHLRGRKAQRSETSEPSKREESSKSAATGTTADTNVTISEPPTAKSVNTDTPIRSIEDTFIEAVGWQPHYTKTLKSLSEDVLFNIPNLASTTTFTWDFLAKTLGQNEWSGGFFYEPLKSGETLLPGRSYAAYDATNEPYLPVRPGHHGAKLTAFFNDNPEDGGSEAGEEIYSDFPVFIRASNFTSKCFASPDRYIYFGAYTQSRWSDKLDYDHMINDVPHDVKMSWATKLADSNRPEWMTKCLKEHFWPKPVYEGAMPGSVPANGSVTDGVEEDEHLKQVHDDVHTYISQLNSWDKDATMRVNMLNADRILDAFTRPDAGDPPGLRLQWEYLECVGYDRKLYDMLEDLQRKQ